MSGGSLDYVYSRIDSTVFEIRRLSQKPLHLAFAKHLEKVAEALHDLEWLLSGDYGDGDEEESIRQVVTKEVELEILIEDAKVLIGRLQEFVDTDKTKGMGK